MIHRSTKFRSAFCIQFFFSEFDFCPQMTRSKTVRSAKMIFKSFFKIFILKNSFEGCFFILVIWGWKIELWKKKLDQEFKDIFIQVLLGQCWWLNTAVGSLCPCFWALSFPGEQESILKQLFFWLLWIKNYSKYEIIILFFQDYISYFALIMDHTTNAS